MHLEAKVIALTPFTRRSTLSLPKDEATQDDLTDGLQATIQTLEHENNNQAVMLAAQMHKNEVL